MGMRNGVPPISHRDLMEASKTVYDQVLVKSLELVEDKIKDTEINLVSRVVKVLRKEVEDMVSSIMISVKEQIEEMSRRYEASLNHTHELIKSLPTPQVNFSVPENAIQIKQLPSQVNVESPQVHFSVPENAIQIKQEKSIVNFTMPEMKSPDIHVNVPELKLPQVNVNVPKRGKVSKSISYDDNGRPIQIEEREDD